MKPLVVSVALLGWALISGATSPALAQSYPAKTIKIIVGPSPDVIVRVIAQHLQEAWGQPVVVEPRPGAGGQLAANAVASAEPDGHTLLFATPSYPLNTALKTASYDLERDFAPAALFGVGAYALVVNPRVPAKSIAELVQLARTEPGKLNCASAGIGTVPQLVCETLNTVPGVKVVHVPYRGVNEAMNGLVAGQVDLFPSVSAVARQQIESGTVRGLAVTSERRSQFLPDLPTMVEAGYPNFVMPSWGGLLAPKRTPKSVLDKINAEVRRGLEQSQIRERLAVVGLEPPPRLDVDQFGQFIRDDVARWTALVGAVGIEKLAPATGQTR